MSRALNRANFDAMELRRATPEDSPRLSKLADQVFREIYPNHLPEPALSEFLSTLVGEGPLRAQLTDPQHACYLAERDGELLGFAEVHFDSPCPFIDRPTAELCRNYVHPKARGHGLGTAFFHRRCDAARARGLEIVWMRVFENNSTAQKFHFKNGFYRIGTLPYTLKTQHAHRVDDDWILARKI